MIPNDRILSMGHLDLAAAQCRCAARMLGAAQSTEVQQELGTGHAMLNVEFERVQKMLGSVSALSWIAVNINGDRLDVIEASADPDLTKYAADLAKALKAWKQPQDMAAAASLYEIYAEAIALEELKTRAQKKGFTIR